MAIREVLRSLAPRFLRCRREERQRLIDAVSSLRGLQERSLMYQTEAARQSHKNPLCRCGSRCFSQADEDGITLEILERIGCLNDGVFAEFGVGDGTENNTLILKALGWKGFWVGAQDLAFEVKQPNATFTFTKEWITLDNITALAAEGLKNLGCNGIDVLSLDLDGNDLYLVEALLKAGHVPKLLVVEYNAKFIPPVKWQIDYDPGHTWQCDDYFGASLASFDELFRRYRYRLVCCNSQTGSNAFFVRDKYSQAFADVPTEIADIYVPPNYFPLPWIGHRPNLKTIARLFS